METPTMDVVTCGELLIDFVAPEVGATLAQASLFQKAPGGALSTTQIGALSPLPSLDAVQSLLQLADTKEHEDKKKSNAD